jgi:hypothetical protein
VRLDTFHRKTWKYCERNGFRNQFVEKFAEKTETAEKIEKSAGKLLFVFTQKENRTRKHSANRTETAEKITPNNENPPFSLDSLRNSS